MLILTPKQAAQVLNIDTETVRHLMSIDAIKSCKRSELLNSKSDQLVTTPLAVIDFIAERFGLEKTKHANIIHNILRKQKRSKNVTFTFIAYYRHGTNNRTFCGMV